MPGTPQPATHSLHASGLPLPDFSLPSPCTNSLLLDHGTCTCYPRDSTIASLQRAFPIHQCPPLCLILACRNTLHQLPRTSPAWPPSPPCSYSQRLLPVAPHLRPTTCLMPTPMPYCYYTSPTNLTITYCPGLPPTQAPIHSSTAMQPATTCFLLGTRPCWPLL